MSTSPVRITIDVRGAELLVAGLRGRLDELAAASPVELCAVCDHSRQVHDELPADHEFEAKGMTW